MLAPTLAGLSKLVPVWDKAVRRAGLAPGVPPAEQAPEEERTTEGPGILGVEQFNPLEAAQRPFKEDTFIANSSNIALLPEYDRRSILPGGDAFPSVLHELNV